MSIPESEGRLVPEETNRWEALVQRITREASFELARRRANESLTYIYARWSRRLIPAAAVLVAVSGALLGAWGLGVPASDESESPLTLAEVLTPQPLALWFEEASQPTLVEMVAALEGDAR